MSIPTPTAPPTNLQAVQIAGNPFREETALSNNIRAAFTGSFVGNNLCIGAMVGSVNPTLKGHLLAIMAGAAIVQDELEKTLNDVVGGDYEDLNGPGSLIVAFDEKAYPSLNAQQVADAFVAVALPDESVTESSNAGTTRTQLHDGADGQRNTADDICVGTYEGGRTVYKVVWRTTVSYGKPVRQANGRWVTPTTTIDRFTGHIGPFVSKLNSVVLNLGLLADCNDVVGDQVARVLAVRQQVRQVWDSLLALEGDFRAMGVFKTSEDVPTYIRQKYPAGRRIVTDGWQRVVTSL